MKDGTNRELLELAAKAAGINGEYCNLNGAESIWWNNDDDCVVDWNPLTDDRDALMLAVDLKIGVSIDDIDVSACPSNASAETILSVCSNERIDGDPYSAMRRAITRAAAAIATQHHPVRLGEIRNLKADAGELVDAYSQLKAAYSKPSAARTRAEAWRRLDAAFSKHQESSNGA